MVALASVSIAVPLAAWGDEGDGAAEPAAEGAAALAPVYRFYVAPRLVLSGGAMSADGSGPAGGVELGLGLRFADHFAIELSASYFDSSGAFDEYRTHTDVRLTLVPVSASVRATAPLGLVHAFVRAGAGALFSSEHQTVQTASPGGYGGTSMGSGRGRVPQYQLGLGVLGGPPWRLGWEVEVRYLYAPGPALFEPSSPFFRHAPGELHAVLFALGVVVGL